MNSCWNHEKKDKKITAETVCFLVPLRTPPTPRALAYRSPARPHQSALTGHTAHIFVDLGENNASVFSGISALFSSVARSRPTATTCAAASSAARWLCMRSSTNSFQTRVLPALRAIALDEHNPLGAIAMWMSMSAENHATSPLAFARILSCHNSRNPRTSGQLRIVPVYMSVIEDYVLGLVFRPSTQFSGETATAVGVLAASTTPPPRFGPLVYHQALSAGN